MHTIRIGSTPTFLYHLYTLVFLKINMKTYGPERKTTQKSPIYFTTSSKRKETTNQACTSTPAKRVCRPNQRQVMSELYRHSLWNASISSFLLNSAFFTLNITLNTLVWIYCSNGVYITDNQAPAYFNRYQEEYRCSRESRLLVPCLLFNLRVVIG